MSLPAQAPAGAAPAVCDHCSLPVPRGRIDGRAERQFCCEACRFVFEAIHSCGLGRYYAMRDDVSNPVAATTTGGAYAVYDTPSFEALYVIPEGVGRRIELYLEGAHCAACVWLVERLPTVLDGVLESRLDIGRQRATITWDPQRIRLSRIARLLDSIGYPTHPYRSTDRDQALRREDRRHLIRIAVSGACAGNVMLIAFALYGGMLNGIEAEYRALFRWSALGITLVALAWPGSVFLRGAWSSLRTRMMHMDVPVAVALVAGTGWGLINTVRGTGEVYFESLTAVIFLLLVGRWIRHRQQRSAADAVELLYRMTPSTARRLRGDGSIEPVPLQSLERGDLVEVLAGDSVPADGIVEDGRSEIDLSLLNGESEPVVLARGDAIHAGTVNLGSRVVLRVECAGEQTRVGRLMSLVERLAVQRPPLVRVADRVAHRFVLTVLGCALVTLGLWIRVDPSLAIEHAIALLIVTCPCALGLATPLALLAAIGRAAQAGILIKGGDALERLATPGILLLDKTGTMTRGRTELVLWHGDDAVRPAIVALESRMAHPIARAFLVAFEGTPPAEVSHVRRIPGAGVEGRIDGQAILVGSASLIGTRVRRVPGWAGRAEARCVARALTPVFVAVDGTVRAVAGMGDPLHADAARSVARLRRRGWLIEILSGDHPGVVAAVGDVLGIDAAHREAEADPERKVEVVRDRIGRRRPVVMVGDGVNDAAALSAADVGVAVRGGAEASLAASDVFLRRPGLGAVVDLVDGARRTVALIRWNIAISLGYNVIAGGLAMAGRIDPLIAAVLMPLSSLSVLSLSYRARTFAAGSSPWR